MTWVKGDEKGLSWANQSSSNILITKVKLGGGVLVKGQSYLLQYPYLLMICCCFFLAAHMLNTPIR